MVAAALIALAAASPARADGDPHPPSPKRRVAVLEYRAGSSALEAIDARIARLLGKETSLGVVNADDARKRYGGSLDSDVVACSGDAACVAKLGARLGVAEVLLVGVSELGDVILTLQRVDVKRRGVAARIAEALAVGARPSDDDLGRYLARVMPESDFLRYGTVYIDANLTGAEVEIGAEKHGLTPVQAIRVKAPATYDIQVTKRGYTPFRAQVVVPPEGEVRVKAELTRRAAAARWYQKWWVVGLAVGAAGLTVGAVLYSRQNSDSVPVSGHVDLVRF